MFRVQQLKLMKLLMVPLGISFLLFSFQNCMPGFQSGDLALSVPLPSNSEVQTKALGILRTNCQTCHINQSLGGISNIANATHLLSTGLIIPGNINSPLMRSINDNSMPPSGPLTEADKIDLRNWILALAGQGPIQEQIDLSFNFNVSFDPLIFPNRLNKLNYVIGSNPGTSLNALISNRFLLGDYNFSTNVIPNYSWGATEMLNWSENLQSFCSSPNFLNQFAWITAAEVLMERAYGRMPDSQDMSIFNEINTINNINDQERIQILCLTLLTSMEFITK